MFWEVRIGGVTAKKKQKKRLIDTLILEHGTAGTTREVKRAGLSGRISCEISCEL